RLHGPGNHVRRVHVSGDVVQRAYLVRSDDPSQRCRDLFHAVELPHAKSFGGVEHPRDRDRTVGEVEHFRHLFFEGFPDREGRFRCK
ncbi:MAG: hypothetical protein ACK559_35910, partial [bacterium]